MLVCVCSDRVRLVCADKVDRAQSVLLAAMQHLASRNHHRNTPHFLARLVHVMTEMRTLSELHREWEETLNMDWSSEFKIPPLLYEIASV